MAEGLTVSFDAPALAVLERRLAGLSARAVLSLRAEATKAMAMTANLAKARFAGKRGSKRGSGDIYAEDGSLRPHTGVGSRGVAGGNLKRSIRMLESSPRPGPGGSTEYEWSVGTNVNYARHVELGGRTRLGQFRGPQTAAAARSMARRRAGGIGRAFSRPHPYLTPGFAAGTARFALRAREILERELAAGGAGTVS